ncbi:MAG: transcription antitermination factor NusB [Saprospiraceae bacterium]|nr:transcription antitermination factor NusB [Saprospiraceae bacterium]
MLSRRNVRIKVMQLLYAQSRDGILKFEDLLRHYKRSIQGSYELFLFSLLQMVRIAEYAKHDAATRKAKLLPNEADKAFKAILADNELTASIYNNQSFKQKTEQLRLIHRTEMDNARKIYAEFLKTEEYLAYIELAEYTTKDHETILLDLFKFCLKSDLYNDIVEDNYPLWTDDKSLVVGTIKKIIKALPASERLFDEYLPNDETTEFGEELLKIVLEEDQMLLNIIEPVLKNWDAERVAIIDMILLKMALVELLNFPTIPTKVTLNEFVEISKLYSTDKSKDFINGILDRLMKQLIKEGKIQKEGRGLQS